MFARPIEQKLDDDFRNMLLCRSMMGLETKSKKPRDAPGMNSMNLALQCQNFFAAHDIDLFYSAHLQVSDIFRGRKKLVQAHQHI